MSMFALASRKRKYRRLGDQARDEKRWADAATFYGRHLKHSPGDAPILVQYGHALKEAGRIGEAEQAYRRAIEAKPEEADTYVQLGHVFKLTGRTEAAIEAYSSALTRAPSLESAAAELRVFDEQRRAQEVRWQEEARSPDPRLEPLIRHVSSLLEQLSTVKAVSFAVARAKTEIVRIEHRHRESEQRVAELQSALEEAKAILPLEFAAMARQMDEAVQKAMAALDRSAAETANYAAAFQPELRAFGAGLARLQSTVVSQGSTFTRSLAQVDERAGALAKQLETAHEAAAAQQAGLQSTGARLDQLSRHVHELSESIRGLPDMMQALQARIESLEQRPPPAVPPLVDDMLCYLTGRVEFIRREVMYEFQHGHRSAATLKAATEVQNNVKHPGKLEAARQDGIALNLGCGHVMLDGYLNVDRRDLPGVDIVAEADDLPFAPGEVRAIHSAHLLEHFPEQEMRRRLLPYWFRLLQPGGQFSAILPDGRAMLAHAGQGNYKFEEFREVLFGAQDYVGDYHYALYTPDSLVALLREVGFMSIVCKAEGRRNGLCYEFEVVAQRPSDDMSGESGESSV